MAKKPAKTLDPRTLREAINWSLQYFLNPKLGNRTKLPNKSELATRFPDSQIDEKLIEFELKNLLGVKNLQDLAENEQKVSEVLNQTNDEDQKENHAQEEHTAQHHDDLESLNKTLRSRGKVSAFGVLAELETIEPLLQKHNQESSQKLRDGLAPQIKKLMPILGLNNINDQVVSEIAQETARQVLEDVAKIQNPEETILVVADSLTQTIVTHPDISKQLKLEDQKVFETVAPQLKEVVDANQKDLEKAAVLGNLKQIAKFQKPDENLLATVSQNVQETVEANAPLASPEVQEQIKASLGTYLASYNEQLRSKLPKITADSIPSFQQLQEIKEAAHSQATAQISTNFQKTQAGKTLAKTTSYTQVASNLASSLGLIKSKANEPLIPKLSAGAGLVLSSQTRQTEAYHALLSYDQDKLTTNLTKMSEEIKKFKDKKTLTHKELKQLYSLQQKYQQLKTAQIFSAKKTRRASAYRTIIATAFGGRLDVASNLVWAQYPQFIYQPEIINNNPRLFAQAQFGKLGFSFAGFNPGALINSIRSQSHFSLGSAMGMNPTSGIKGAFAKARNISGAIFGGTMLYLLGLGQAVAAGAITGAAIGGLSGAVTGAVVPVAMLGPAGVLLWPITIPLGFFVGGTMGAVIGGAIAYGLSTGTVPVVTAGAGAAAGATIGGIAGFNAGLALAAGCVVITGGLCTPVTPLIVLGSTAVGSFVGFILGGVIGWAVGNFIITPVFSSLSFLSSGGASALATGSSVLASAGSFITGAGSTLWGGLTGGLSGGFGILSSGLNSLISIGSTATGVFASAPILALTAGTVTTVGTLGIVGAVTTGAAFFSLAADENPSVTPGQNEFFEITKTSDVPSLDNPPPAKEVTFTITLKAKSVSLTNVKITDEIKVQKKDSSFNVLNDKDGQPISPRPCPTELTANEACTSSYTITVDENFKDSTIINTATVKATPQNQTEKTDSVTTTVTVGTPPADCPHGWPTIGDVTQGPEGPTSHGPDGYEALDIGQGTSFGGEAKEVKATVEGKVIESDPRSDPQDQRIIVQPLTCASLHMIFFTHLSRRDVQTGDTVHFGQTIGKTGAPLGSDGIRQPHLHYQFNNSFDRSFKIESPYVPVSVPRACNGDQECHTHISNSP